MAHKCLDNRGPTVAMLGSVMIITPIDYPTSYSYVIKYWSEEEQRNTNSDIDIWKISSDPQSVHEPVYS